jgi:pimeloyl-ACP methyl ester carboxylesterase
LEQIADPGCPVQVSAGAESAPFFVEASQWLAARLNTTVITTSGGHAPYFDQPEAVATMIRSAC